MSFTDNEEEQSVELFEWQSAPAALSSLVICCCFRLFIDSGQDEVSDRYSESEQEPEGSGDELRLLEDSADPEATELLDEPEPQAEAEAEAEADALDKAGGEVGEKAQRISPRLSSWLKKKFFKQVSY